MEPVLVLRFGEKKKTLQRTPTLSSPTLFILVFPLAISNSLALAFLSRELVAVDEPRLLPGAELGHGVHRRHACMHA
jgi:hypothetical protein